MLRRSILTAALVALAGCASPGAKVGLDEVQQLSARIEGVQKSIDDARQQVGASVKALQGIAAFDFKDDPADAYADFVATVEASTHQVEQLRASVAAMQDVAEPLFQKWEANLDTFASDAIRAQSKQRQADTRSRYDAIVSATDAAQTAFDAFNKSLNDHVAYLRYDFNAASLAVIQDEVGKLEQSSALLDTQFKSCQIAARVYIEAAALPKSAPAAKPAPAADERKRADG